MKQKRNRLVIALTLGILFALSINKEITKAQTTEPFKLNTLDAKQKTQGENESKPQSDKNQKARILFIGNSHTFYNHMPDMVQGLASGAGINW